MSRQVLGMIELGYGSRVALPLEEAHKIQLILAKHAVGVERAHTKDYTAVSYMADFKTPEVSVISDDALMDTRGLTAQQIKRWLDMIKDMQTGGPVVDPHTFATIYGEEDETNS